MKKTYSPLVALAIATTMTAYPVGYDSTINDIGNTATSQSKYYSYTITLKGNYGAKTVTNIPRNTNPAVPAIKADNNYTSRYLI